MAEAPQIVGIIHFYSICILRSISVMPTIASSCLSRSLKSLMVFPPSICGRANLEGGARPAFKASLDPSRYGKSPLV